MSPEYCACRYEGEKRIPHPWCPYYALHQLPDPPPHVPADAPDPRDWDDEE